MLNSFKSENASTLLDDSFAELTFDGFYAYGIKRISNKAFGKAAKTIKYLSCEICSIVDSPSHYNIWIALNQTSQLLSLTLGLNVTEIPSNAITSNDQQNSTLKSLSLSSKQNLTIKSNAFNNLDNLNEFQLKHTIINIIEEAAFNFSGNSNKSLDIYIYDVKLSNNSFANGSFEGVERPLDILFQSTNVSYIPISSFKNVLDNQKSKIRFDYFSFIDCEDCRNFWLIGKEKQIKEAKCKTDRKKLLFDSDIQSKLKSKCKQFVTEI